MIHFLHLPADLPARFVNYPSLSLLGPLSAAAWLESRGETVTLWDALVAADPHRPAERQEDGWLLGAPPDPDDALAAMADASLVIFPLDMYRHPHRAWGHQVRRLTDACRAARPEVGLYAADCHLGGVDYVPVDAGALLETLPHLDGYVRGEPELALERLAAGEPPETIPGVVTRRRATDAGYGDPLPGLDDAPPPAWHLVDVERFFRAQRRLVEQDFIHELHAVENLLPAMTSRGCPYRCTFCAGVPGRQYRALSPETLAHHLAAFRDLGSTALLLLDDVMNLQEERFHGALSALRDAGLRWTPVNGLRADRLERDHVRRFASCGGFNLKVSAESGDPRVLREVVCKAMDPEDVTRVARWAAAESTPLQVHYVIGFPQESVREANRTLTLAARLHEEHGATPRVQVATPVPGTALHREARQAGLLPEDPDRFALLASFVGGPLLDPPQLPADLQAAMLRLHRQRAERTDHPVLLLDPGYRCNQRCTFCSTALMKRPDAAEETLEGAIRWAVQRSIRRLDLGGGEPTLYDALPALIRQARRAGMDDIGVVTNGRRLGYPRYLEALQRAGLTRVVLSAAGHHEALHDAVTQAPGTLPQVLRGLDELATRPSLPVTLNLVACRSTAPELGETLRFFTERWAFVRVNVQVALPMGNAVVTGETFPQLEDLLPALEDALAGWSGPPLSIHNLPPCFLPHHLDQVLDDAFKGGRYMLAAGDTPVPFAGIIGKVLTHLPYCEACPARLVCGGVPKGLRARYEGDAHRPAHVAEALVARERARQEVPS